MSQPSTRKLTLSLAFAVGASVYLRTRPERLEGVVSGLVVRPGNVKYLVAWGDASEGDHWDFELSEEPEL
jgi:hypothetical protein